MEVAKGLRTERCQEQAAVATEMRDTARIVGPLQEMIQSIDEKIHGRLFCNVTEKNLYDTLEEIKVQKNALIL